MFSNPVSHVNSLLQTGQLNVAESVCRSALSTREDAELRGLLGIICTRLGRPLEGAEHLETACRLSPRNHAHLVNLGTVYGMTGQSAKAADCFRRAIAIKPSIAEAHYNLGNAEKDLRHFEAAVTAYRKAIQLNPSHAAAWSNLGGALMELTRIEESAVALRRAISLNPQLASAHTNLGTILLYLGQLEESERSNKRALTINPQNHDAYRNLGAIAMAQLNYQDALNYYTRATSLNSESVPLLYELANVQNTVFLQDSLVETLQTILAKNPSDATAWRMLGIMEMERGNVQASKEVFARGISTSEDLAIRVRATLSLPPIVDSVQHIDEIRSSLIEGLDRLAEAKGELDDPIQQLGTNFYLAYHGRSTKAFHSRISALYRKWAPSINFLPKFATEAMQSKPKLRIGFYSKFIYKHSVSTSFSRVVEELSQHKDLEIFIISTTTHSNERVRDTYSRFSGAFVYVPTNLNVAHAVVGSLELDFLVYLDLGMDPFSYLLAHARLARYQCVMGGHPDTSGIDTVDYYLSAHGLEAPGAETEYSERLVELKAGGFSLTRPSAIAPTASRESLGLPSQGAIYLCPMMLQKLHPDFDAALDQILALDTTGSVVLFGAPISNRWVELLSKRLDRSVSADVRDRIVFHPWIESQADFQGTLQASNVVIDPFHFGIGTTAAVTAAVGVPYVTLPGEFARGRVGQYFAKMLNVAERCVASDLDDYVKKAVSIANDSDLRAQLSKTIISNNDCLYENHTAAAADLYDFFTRTTNTTH
jgi:protein O-GlcNAc transferase